MIHCARPGRRRQVVPSSSSVLDWRCGALGLDKCVQSAGTVLWMYTRRVLFFAYIFDIFERQSNNIESFHLAKERILNAYKNMSSSGEPVPGKKEHG